jgi:hypothetical protein
MADAKPAQPPLRAKKGGWKLFRAELWRRFAQAFENPVFFLYFFGIVVLVAGVGIWITCGRYLLSTYPDAAAEALAIRGILESAATYAVAISATALADIFLASQKNSVDAPSPQSIPRSIFIFCFILTGAVIACLVGAFFFPLYWAAVAGATVSMVVGLVQWWLINADNPSLADDDDPSQLIGNNPLDKLSGSLEGYTT